MFFLGSVTLGELTFFPHLFLESLVGRRGESASDSWFGMLCSVQRVVGVTLKQAVGTSLG